MSGVNKVQGGGAPEEMSFKASEEALKNTQEQLKGLLSLTQAIEEALHSENSSISVSNEQIAEVLSYLTGALSTLQAATAQLSTSQSTQNTKVSNQLLEKAREVVEKIEKALKEMARAQDKAGMNSEILRGVTIACTALMLAVACMTGNVALAAVAVSLLIMQESGGMEKTKNALAQSLESCMSPQAAAIFADCLIACVLLVAGGAAGYLGAPAAEAVVLESTTNPLVAEISVETSSTISTSSSVSVGSSGSTGVASTGGTSSTGQGGAMVATNAQANVSSSSSSATSLLGKLAETAGKVFQELGKALSAIFKALFSTNTGVVAALQGLPATNFFGDLATAFTPKNATEKEKQEIMIACSVIGMVLCMAGGTAVAFSSAPASISGAAKFLSKETLYRITLLATALMAAGEATKVVMNSLLAETKFVQAGLQEQLGEQNALQTILKTMEDILNQALSTVLSASDSSLQSQQGAQSDLLKNISKGQEEWTKTLGSS